MNNKIKIVEKPFAHRGLHNSEAIPENSILAFENALKENYPIELDVRLTSDNKVIVFHDANLQRMTGVQKKISDLTLEDIKKVKINNPNLTIPTLDEVLELVNGEVSLLIEIKNNGKPGLLEKELIKLLLSYKGYFAIQSFNPFSCYWFKKKYPQIDVGQISSNFKYYKIKSFKKFILRNMLFNFLVKPDFISYDIDALPNDIINRIREIGIPTLSWTIKTREQLEKAKKYSDNFIFESLDIIKYF